MARCLRSIVFIGNCQAGVLAALYRRRVAVVLDQDVVYIAVPFSNPERELPEVLATVEKADLVVQQKFDSADAVPEQAFAGQTPRRVRFPYLSGRLYWPYSGVAHIRAEQAPDQGQFPYVAEIGDSLLNQMILDEVPYEAALARYDATVAGSTARIRRLAELHLERQRERDIACDMHFADLIAANYQREALFTTQGHPGMMLTRLLVEKLFVAMDVPYSLVDAAVRSLRISPFPRQELPFHTGVAAALGLGFVTPGQRYVFQHEGAFTFAEYVRRYLGSIWEPELSLGLAQLFSGDPGPAVRRIQAALRRCEGSATAWRSLSIGLGKLGQNEAAEEALAVALQRDPGDPEGFAALAQQAARRGRLAEAEVAARRAIELFPFGPVGHRALADVLARRGRLAEAAAVARIGVAAEPGDTKGLLILAHHLQRAGELHEAERLLRRAAELEPDNANFHRLHAAAEARVARADARAA